MIWFVILTIMTGDGSLYTSVYPAGDPKFNNEEDCNTIGQLLADQKQGELQLENGRAFYICESITKEQLDRVLK
jgi:hypothetical protein